MVLKKVRDYRNSIIWKDKADYLYSLSSASDCLSVENEKGLAKLDASVVRER